MFLQGLGRFIKRALIAAKGDLIAGTANDTPAILSVGTDGKYLKADSGETAGLKWDTPSGISFTTFSYTGTGNDDLAVTGLGFQPTYVRIHPHINDGSHLSTDKNDKMGLNTKLPTGTYTTNYVKSLDADGFTLGTNASVNSVGNTYSGEAWA